MTRSFHSDDLASLAKRLSGAPGLMAKRAIQAPASALASSSSQRGIRNGDDAAALPDGDGYLLVAGEGMQPDFVRRDPWFAGFCAVMVNVSDIAAMGGRATAIVDMLFSGGDSSDERLLAGMRDGSEAFGVPIVGGHTTVLVSTAPMLAAAVVGRARQLITSFDVRPGQLLLHAVDLRGTYRSALNFNAATHASPRRTRACLEVLPNIAEAGLCRAGKDVSMAGLLGTLAMLCESSQTGAVVDLDAIVRPSGVDEERWLLSFPSFGFLLAVDVQAEPQVQRAFAEVGVSCSPIGEFTAGRDVYLSRGAQSARFWSDSEPLCGFASMAAAKETSCPPIHPETAEEVMHGMLHHC